MRFVDETRLRVAAGDGGDGCVAFLREKGRPRGGPSGGDGGDGGSIIARADNGLSTLLDYRYQNLFRAERGGDGGGKSKNGKSAPDVFMMVPVGTIIHHAETGDVLADLSTHGEEVLLARGGLGGRGNARFATPTHQAPRRADPGTPGEGFEITLELRLLADVGLIGLPNAGKSSLLGRVSAARPRVADYPFTTLEPSLGVVAAGGDRSFVMADIPGLIEGAHEGQGLGDRFLRHVSRAALLLHLLDATDKTVEETVAAYQMVNNELAQYSDGLDKREQLAVLTKIDLPDVTEKLPELTKAFSELGVEVYPCSSATGDGCEELVKHVGTRVSDARKAMVEDLETDPN